MTYEVQQTRWDRIIRRVSGSIGPGSRVSETISELFPMIDVERVPGELLILGGTQLCNGGGFLTAEVGVSPKGMIFNPEGSGHLITVTSVYAASGGSGNMRWGTTVVQFFPVISTQVFRDTRSLAPALPVGQISQLGEVALASGTNQTRVLGSTTLKLEDPNGIAVLAPGSGFEIGPNNQNQTFAFSFYWRERPAEESELNL